MMLLLGLIGSLCVSARVTPMMDNQLMMNYMMMSKLGSDSDMSTMKKMMLMSPGLFGQDPVQADQMSPLLPLIMMNDDNDDSDSSSKALMMMLMQNPNQDMSQILPLLMMSNDDNDDDSSNIDMKNLFLMTTMMQGNCDDTNQQMNALLPLLMMGDDN